jgi:hypothetical protein
MLFLVDITLKNSWIYYSMANDKEREIAGERADFFIPIARNVNVKTWNFKHFTRYLLRVIDYLCGRLKWFLKMYSSDSYI